MTAGQTQTHVSVSDLTFCLEHEIFLERKHTNYFNFLIKILHEQHRGELCCHLLVEVSHDCRVWRAERIYTRSRIFYLSERWN